MVFHVNVGDPVAMLPLGVKVITSAMLGAGKAKVNGTGPPKPSFAVPPMLNPPAPHARTRRLYSPFASVIAGVIEHVPPLQTSARAYHALCCETFALLVT